MPSHPLCAICALPKWPSLRVSFHPRASRLMEYLTAVLNIKLEAFTSVTGRNLQDQNIHVKRPLKHMQIRHCVYGILT